MNSSQATIFLNVNGTEAEVAIAQDETLLDVLRDKLRLTGTKRSCGQGECGACTVLVNSRPVMSCLSLAILMPGKSIQTIEGLEQSCTILREAFADRGAFQCGFCTSGQIVRASALVNDSRLKSCTQQEKEVFIRKQISGNICRCTGYNAIVDAILDASSAAT